MSYDKKCQSDKSNGAIPHYFKGYCSDFLLIYCAEKDGGYYKFIYSGALALLVLPSKIMTGAQRFSDSRRRRS
jgi:hypothetical protein